MAQLAVAGGGAAVGAVAGSIIPGVGTLLGAQIGWALGGVAGALLFPPKGQDTQGPRLGDLSVQTSGYGVPIPVVAAQAKLAGNVIWKTDIEERRTTRRQGKGGGGAKTTTYSYYLSWAVGLCEWLIPPTNPGVLRIWLDNKLVYDTTGLSPVVKVPGLSWRFYPGSATQFPDPLIEATVGSTEAPAHRGLAYIVFDDVPLDSFGNRMPNVTVELAAEVVSSFPQVFGAAPASPLWPSAPSGRNYNATLSHNIAVDHARGRIYEGRSRTSGTVGTPADEMIRVYDLVTMQAVSEHRLDSVLAPLVGGTDSLSLQGNGATVPHVGADGFLYIAGGTSNLVPIIKIDPDAMAAVDYYGAALRGQTPSLVCSGPTWAATPILITSFQVPRLAATPRTFLAIVGSCAGCFLIDADRMEYVWGAETSVSPLPFAGNGALSNGLLVKIVPGLVQATGTDVWVIESGAGTPTVTFSRLAVASGAANLGGGAAMGITRYPEGVLTLTTIDASATRATVVGAFYDQTDDSMVVTVAGAGEGVGNYTRLTTFKWQAGAVVWSLVNHAGSGADDARGEASRYLSSLWGRGGNLVVQPGSGGAIVNASGAAWLQTTAWLDEQQAVIGWTAGNALTKRYLTRASPNALTVGDVVSALCERAGLTVSDVNTAALSDTLRGYTLARPMSARDAITPLAAAFQFDAVEQDDVLVFLKRAGAVVETIPYVDLVREDPDSSVIEEQRAQDADLPREVTVRFADIERGWEQNAQSWRRPISPTATMTSRGAAAIDLPMPLTVSEGKTVARRQCIATWRERTRLSFSVGPKFARLVPTDPINVGMRDGATIRARVLSTQLGANWVTRVEAVTEDAAVYGLTAVGDGGNAWDEPTMPMPYYTRLVVPNLALVEDGDDLGGASLREYAFACAYSAGSFRGVRVVRSADGTAWSDIGLADTTATWGALLVAPTLPGTPWTWDEVGSLAVRLNEGDLDSATSVEVLNGANVAALVGVDGAAEIVQWRTAALQADGSYLLTGLLRGRRGTEDQIPRRAAGDLFLLMDASRLSFAGSLSEISVARLHRALSIFDTVETARPTVIKSRRGRAEQPYAVCGVTSSRDGSQNLTINWVRRTRVGGELLDGTGVVPLSETSEAYEVDILSGPLSTVQSVTRADLHDGDPATIMAYSSGYPYALEVTLASPQRIANYGWDSGAGFVSKCSPSAWTFEGWDGAAWVVLDTRSGITSMTNFEVRTYAIAAPGEYVRYRWNISAATAGTFMVLGELLLYRGGVTGPNLAAFAYAQAVKRTIASATPTAAYSAANQTTDFGATQPEIFARIFQMSTAAGRGIAAEVIV